jgi:hypothetical protein
MNEPAPPPDGAAAERDAYLRRQLDEALGERNELRRSPLTGTGSLFLPNRERTGEGRKRAMANGVKFGRKPKLSPYQRVEAIKRRAAGETLASIARSYAVDISMISRFST